MRQPLLLGLRPAASSSTPALASSSWNVPISSKHFSASPAKRPASVSAVAFTMIMNLMLCSCVCPYTTTTARAIRNRRMRLPNLLRITGAGLAHFDRGPFGGRAFARDRDRFFARGDVDEEEAADHFLRFG